jgi:hypothetical protein
MDWKAFFISLGGLIVAALSLFFTYKSRTALYRDKLYTKQIDGYTEIMKVLSELFADTLVYVTVHHPLNDEQRAALRTQTVGKYNLLMQTNQKWSIFLPKEFEEQVGNFIKVFLGISAFGDYVSGYPSEITGSSDPGKLLAGAYQKVIAAARKGIGTEPLSQETLKLLGKPRGD